MSDNGLWDYAVALYSRDDVKPALLGLQTRRNADINVLLFCCWCAATGRGALDVSSLHDTDKAVAPWRETVTKTLRAVRDAIAAQGPLVAMQGAGQVRERVLQAELDAERVTLRLLHDLAVEVGDTSTTPPAEAALTSLGRYCQVLGFAPDEDDTGALFVLLQAAFDIRADTALRSALHAAAAPDGD